MMKKNGACDSMDANDLADRVAAAADLDDQARGRVQFDLAYSDADVAICDALLATRKPLPADLLSSIRDAAGRWYFGATRTLVLDAIDRQSRRKCHGWKRVTGQWRPRIYPGHHPAPRVHVSEQRTRLHGGQDQTTRTCYGGHSGRRGSGGGTADRARSSAHRRPSPSITAGVGK